MASKWSAKVNVHTGADAGAATLGLLSGTADFLRMNTDVVWANRPVAIFANNDIIRSVIGPHGGLFKCVSDASLVESGGYSDQKALVAYSRADVAGEPDGNNITLKTASDSGAHFAAMDLATVATSTGAAGQFVSAITIQSENATNVSEIAVFTNSTAGTSLQLIWEGAGTTDSEINMQTLITGGVSLDLTGFKAQTFDHAFRINDEDGIVTQFSPFVASGATAIGYLFDTSNTLADDASKLVAFRNNGAEQLNVSRNGGVSIGINTITYYSALAVSGLALLSARNSGAGDPNNNGIGLVTVNGANETTFDIGLTATAGSFTLFSTPVAGSSGFQAGTGASLALFQMLVDGNTKTKLEPSVADGATAVAYIMDTSNTLANAGAALVKWKNNNVEKSSLSFAGGFYRMSAAALADFGDYNSEIAVAGFSRTDLGDPIRQRMQLNVAGAAGLAEFSEVEMLAMKDVANYKANCTLQGITADAESVATLAANIDAGALLELAQNDFDGGSGVITAQCTQLGGASLEILGFKAQTSTTQFRISDEDGVVTNFSPFVADGATAEAYVFDTSNAISNAGARIVSFEVNGTRQASINTGGAYFVGTNQVVGARVVDARIDDAINSGDATTDGVIDACRDALIAHGLCTAA